MKAKFEQYFPVALFIILYKVVLTFKPMDEILMMLPFKRNLFVFTHFTKTC